MTHRNIRHIEFLVSLHRMIRRDVSAHMLISLYAVRSYPGSTYSDIAEHIEGETSVVYKSVRRLMKRGLVEDRRVITNPKTPGDLHITRDGAEFLKGVLDNDEAAGTLPPRQ